MKYLLSLFIVCFSFFTSATHSAGGNINYKPTLVQNEYEITLNLFADCSGISLPDTPFILVRNICGVADDTVQMYKVSEEEISQLCSSQISTTACNGGAISGYKKFIYKTTYTLPMACPEWTISYNLCTRASNVNISGQPCFYIDTKLNNTDFPCNTSVRSEAINQIPYSCANANSTFSPNFTDIDGDSLSFTLVSAMQDLGMPVSYIAPFTLSNPIPNTSLNSEGEISFNCNFTGNFAIVISVEEYSSTGVLKGSSLFEFTIVNLNCQNEIPSFTTNAGFNNFGTNSAIANDTISMGVGDQFCYEVSFADPDPNNVLILSSNVQNILPGSTTSFQGSNPRIMTICWTFDPNYLQNYFSVYSTDDACPVPGVATKLFFLDFPQSLSFIPDTIISCNINSLLGSFCNQLTDPTEWRDTSGLLLQVGTDISCNPCVDPDFLFSTSQLITVNLVSDSTIIKPVFYEYIDLSQSFLDDTTFSCINQSTSLIGLYGQYNEIWETPDTLINQNQFTLQNNDTILVVYTAEITANCQYMDSTLIVPTQTQVTISGDYQELTASVQTNLQWLFNNTPITGATSQTLIPQNNGAYSVVGFNQWNCADTSNVITLAIIGLEENITNINLSRSFDQLTIKNIDEQTEINIYDLQGRLIIQQSIIDSATIIKLPHAYQTFIVSFINQSGQVQKSRKI